MPCSCMMVVQHKALFISFSIPRSREIAPPTTRRTKATTHRKPCTVLASNSTQQTFQRKERKISDMFPTTMTTTTSQDCVRVVSAMIMVLLVSDIVKMTDAFSTSTSTRTAATSREVVHLTSPTQPSSVDIQHLSSRNGRYCFRMMDTKLFMSSPIEDGDRFSSSSDDDEEEYGDGYNTQDDEGEEEDDDQLPKSLLAGYDHEHTILQMHMRVLKDVDIEDAITCLSKYSQSFPFAAVLPVQPLQYLPTDDGGVEIKFLRKKTKEKGSIDGGMRFFIIKDRDGIDIVAKRNSSGQTISKMFSEKLIVQAFVKGISGEASSITETTATAATNPTDIAPIDVVAVESVFHQWIHEKRW